MRIPFNEEQVWWFEKITIEFERLIDTDMSMEDKSHVIGNAIGYMASMYCAQFKENDYRGFLDAIGDTIETVQGEKKPDDVKLC